MRDIVVTTPKTEMENAAREAEDAIRCGGEYFRTLHRCPIDVGEGSRVFYVEDGFIRGYATVDRILYQSEMACDTTGRSWVGACQLIMRAETWKWVKPIAMRGFQGWRYFDVREHDIQIIGNWLDPKPDPEEVGIAA